MGYVDHLTIQWRKHCNVWIFLRYGGVNLEMRESSNDIAV